MTETIKAGVALLKRVLSEVELDEVDNSFFGVPFSELEKEDLIKIIKVQRKEAIHLMESETRLSRAAKAE